MNTLIAFTLLIAAAVAEPQVFYPGYTGVASSYYGGVYPTAYTGSVISSPLVSKTYSPVVASSYVSPYVASTGLVHSIHKRAAVLPLAYNTYKTPASTSPLVYSAATPYVAAAPVVSTYGAYNGAYNGAYHGAYPYASYGAVAYGY